MAKNILTYYETTNPTGSNTIANGYNIGQKWYNSSTGVEYLHSTNGVWIPYSLSGHTHSQYLTGYTETNPGVYTSGRTDELLLTKSGTGHTHSDFIPYTGGTSNVNLGIHNLTVDTNSLFVDSINHRVGIGTVTPLSNVHTIIGSNSTGIDLTKSSIFTTSDFVLGSTGSLMSINFGADTGNTNTYITTKSSGGTVNSNLIFHSGSKISIGSSIPTQQLHTTKNLRLALSTHEINDVDGLTAYGVIYKGTSPFLHNFNYGSGTTVTTLGGNTFLGLDSGNFTMGGTATQTHYGSKNTMIGANSFKLATNAYDNTGVGYGVFGAILNGFSNVAFGNESLASLTIGYNNVAIGTNSLLSATGNRENVAIGFDALRNATSWYNTAIGSGAGSNISSVGNVTMVGYNAGRYYGNGTTPLASASYSTFIGQETRASAAAQTNEIVIGYNAIGNGSNTATLGNDSITKTVLKGNVGINKSIPTEALDVSGYTQSFGFKTSGGTSSQFLKANGSLDNNLYSQTDHTHSQYLTGYTETNPGVYTSGQTDTLLSNYLPLTGGTLSGNLTGTTFYGSGAGLTGIPSTGITGLNLSQISSDGVTASVSSSGFTVNSGATFSGNVGIGTTDVTGTTKFMVNGNSKLSGDTIINGYNTINKKGDGGLTINYSYVSGDTNNYVELGLAKNNILEWGIGGNGSDMWVYKYVKNRTPFSISDKGTYDEVSLIGNVVFNDKLLSTQTLTAITSGTTIVASVDSTLYDAGIFEYVIKNGTNLRAGTITVVHNGTTTEMTEYATNDLGNTTDVNFTSDVSGGLIRLKMITTTGTWTFKSFNKGL